MAVIQECVDRMRIEIVEALSHKGPEHRLSLEFQLLFLNICLTEKGSQVQKRLVHYTRRKTLSDLFCQQTGIAYLTNMETTVKVKFSVKMRTFLGL